MEKSEIIDMVRNMALNIAFSPRIMLKVQEGIQKKSRIEKIQRDAHFKYF